ncbi:MAG: B12-binding domain-containing radical SAM protein [Candidatus Thorarchaeota archaeon]
MKVGLVATHQVTMEKPVPLMECLGVLALAASLREHSINVEIINLYNYYLGCTPDFEKQIDAIKNVIVESNPDVLGFSTMSNNLIIALELCRRVKAELPEIITVLGGPGTSFCAVEVLEAFPQVDAIIRGEADQALPDWINKLTSRVKQHSVKGLVFRENGRIIDNGWPDPIENLDELPIPSYNVCSKHKEYEEQPVLLEVGRGCPYGCIFCSTSKYFSRRFRIKSVERVIEEVELVQKELGNRPFNFNHDLLTFNREYLEELCNRLMKLKKPVRWGCSARLDTIDEVLLSKMSKAGCIGLFLGIETATDRMQKSINKRINLDRLIDCVRHAVNHGISVTLSFIVGFPDEEFFDIEMLWRRLFKAKSLDLKNVITQVHILVPEPGSNLLDELNEDLAYDDVGSPGHSNFPPIEWNDLREVIKKHPLIFPAYFHYGGIPTPRHVLLRYVYLNHLVSGPASHSLAFAYSILGEKVTQHLAAKIEQIELPKKLWPLTDYGATIESTRGIIEPLFEQNREPKLMYDAILKAESAAAEIIREKEDHYVLLDVMYNPIDLMARLRGMEWNDSGIIERNRKIVVYYNEKDKDADFREIPKEAAEILSS